MQKNDVALVIKVIWIFIYGFQNPQPKTKTLYHLPVTPTVLFLKG